MSQRSLPARVAQLSVAKEVEVEVQMKQLLYWKRIQLLDELELAGCLCFAPQQKTLPSPLRRCERKRDALALAPG